MHKKAQSSIEFVIIIGAVLFFFTSFFLVVQKNVEQKNLEKETIIVQNLALAVQDELNLAEKASEGYYREFNIDSQISGRDYDIIIVNNRVYVKTTKVALSYPVVSVTGDIKKGVNMIKKQNGQVYLN